MDVAMILQVVLLAVLLLIGIPLTWLFFRRRWLARRGGLFECGLHVARGTRSDWALGVARYSGENLEWFRALSFQLRPEVTFRRTGTMALGNRDQNGVDTGIVDEGRIVMLAVTQSSGEPRTWELAMDDGSATGLLAWLEAAPPSIGRFRA